MTTPTTTPQASITETRELPHEGTVRSFRTDVARSAMQAEERWRDIGAKAREAGGNPFDHPDYLPLMWGEQAGWGLAALLKWIENKVGAEQAYSAACLALLPLMAYLPRPTLVSAIAADLGIEPEGSTFAAVQTAQIPADMVAKAGERA